MTKSPHIALFLSALLAVGAISIVPSRADSASDKSAATGKPPQAVIPFAQQHGISTWVVANDRTVYVQDDHRQWYRADLMGGCSDLPLAEERLGFKFEPNGDFDKFSAIVYRHQECPLVSLTKSDSPPGYKGKTDKPAQP